MPPLRRRVQLTQLIPYDGAKGVWCHHRPDAFASITPWSRGVLCRRPASPLECAAVGRRRHVPNDLLVDGPRALDDLDRVAERMAVATAVAPSFGSEGRCVVVKSDDARAAGRAAIGISGGRSLRLRGFGRLFFHCAVLRARPETHERSVEAPLELGGSFGHHLLRHRALGCAGLLGHLRHHLRQGGRCRRLCRSSPGRLVVSPVGRHGRSWR